MVALYIAGAASEIDRARKAMRAARDAGFKITSTWVETIEQVGNANPADASVADRMQWSCNCLADIDRADAVWFLVPPSKITTRGAWVETGFAIARSKHLVFSGESTHQSIFCAFGEEFVDDDSALFYLTAWAADRRLKAGLHELRDSEPIAMPVPGDGIPRGRGA